MSVCSAGGSPTEPQVELNQTLNLPYCITTLEESLKKIVEQQSRIVEQLQEYRKQLEKELCLEVRQELENNKSMQEMIKTRQEMIFTK